MLGAKMGAGAIMGAAQAGVGALQAGISALGLRKAKRNASKAYNAIETYTESPEEIANLQAAKMSINRGMPGMAKAEQNIATSAARAISGLKTRKSALMGISSIAEGEQGSLENLATKQAQFKLAAEDKLSAARARMTGERGKAFQSRQAKQEGLYAQKAAILAGKKAAISQGIAAIGQGVGNAITSQNMG